MTLSDVRKEWRTIVMLAGAAVAIAGFGWGSHALIGEQIEVPATVKDNTHRITSLESKVVGIEEALSDQETAFDALRAQLYILGEYEERTYCLVQAHAFDMDPATACDSLQLTPIGRDGS